MTPRQRMRLRALGLQDDPLYWTRPVPISELTAPRTLRWQHASTGFNGLKAADEVPKGALTRADVSHLPRLQTPVSTALEQLIVSLCVEEGWETSSPEASPTRQNGGASGRSSPFQLADSADSQGSVQNGTGKATRNRSKPARVRFREDREGSGEGSSEGGEGKLESGRAEHVHASLRKGEDGNGAGSASESNDEFEKMALRFHKQPVKVQGKETGLDPPQKGTPHPLRNQGYQYTPHPVKGIRKSAQPGTPFPLSKALPGRSPFERKQNLRPITELESGSPSAERPARDGSVGASSSGGSPESSARKRTGFDSTSGTSGFSILEAIEQKDQTSPPGLESSQGTRTQRGRNRVGFAGKPDSLRTTRSLDGQNMLRQGVSSERSAESVLVRQRSPYLAPVRNLRTAGGDSGFGTQRRDRLAQFAAYLEGQKEERADDEMATLGEEDGKRAGSPATSGDRLRTVSDSHLEKQAPSLSEEGSQRRYERGWIQAGSPGRSPTKRPLESGCAAAKPQRWVIGESRPNRQRASALPELKSKRSNGTRVSGGAGSPTPGNGVPAEETSWSKTDKQRRRRRLSKEQAWLNKSHQRMSLWMQDHFAALERIAHLTPSERADAERMWSAAQAAARDRKLNLVKLHSTMVTGLEEDKKGAEAERGRSETTEERPLGSSEQTFTAPACASDDREAGGVEC